MRKDVMKIGAAVLAACMLAGCGGQNTGTQSNPTGDTSAAGSQSAPAEGGEKVVTLANSAAWEALHPLSSNRDQHVSFLYPIYESWVTVTAEGEILPRLFDSWEQSLLPELWCLPGFCV